MKSQISLAWHSFGIEMASQDSSAKANVDYVNQLIKEQEGLNDKLSFAHKLLQQEIERIRADPLDDTQRKDGHIIIHTGKQFRLRVKIHIPIEEHPNFNFVGKLLGPKGSSLQQLQEATQTRMAILGRGSMRDKKKEEDLRAQGDPKYSHLNEELHVEVTAYAPPQEAYRRMSSAVNELKRFLVPDLFDDSRQPQFMNDGKPKPYPADNAPHMGPRGGPLAPRPMGPPIMGGREPPPRRPMVQSTYVASEVDDWAPRPPAQRRGGYHGTGAAQPPAQRGYEEATNDYNNYGDNFGDYNSGNAGAYYDYNAEADAGYADGYADDGRGPMRGGARGGARNNSRLQTHPYPGAPRRGY